METSSGSESMQHLENVDPSSSTQEQKVETYNIFFGRGNGVAQLRGNKFYRNTIKVNKPYYRNAGANAAKERVAKDVVESLKQMGAKFFYQKNGAWVTVPYDEVLKRVKQALRERDRRDTTKASTATAKGDKVKSKRQKVSKKREVVGVKMNEKVVCAIRWRLEDFVADKQETTRERQLMPKKQSSVKASNMGNTIDPKSSSDSTVSDHTVSTNISQNQLLTAKSGEPNHDQIPHRMHHVNVNTDTVDTLETTGTRRKMMSKAASMRPQSMREESEETSNMSKSLNHVDLINKFETADIKQLIDPMLGNNHPTIHCRQLRQRRQNVIINQKCVSDQQTSTHDPNKYISTTNTSDPLNLRYQMPSFRDHSLHLPHDPNITTTNNISFRNNPIDDTIFNYDQLPANFTPDSNYNPSKRLSMPMVNTLSHQHIKPTIHRSSMPMIRPHQYIENNHVDIGNPYSSKGPLSSFNKYTQENERLHKSMPNLPPTFNHHVETNRKSILTQSDRQIPATPIDRAYTKQAGFVDKQILDKRSSLQEAALDICNDLTEIIGTPETASISNKDSNGKLNDNPLKDAFSDYEEITIGGSKKSNTKHEDLSNKALEVFDDLDAIIGGGNVTKLSPKQQRASLSFGLEQENESTLKPDAPSELLKDLSMFSAFGSTKSLQMNEQVLDKGVKCSLIEISKDIKHGQNLGLINNESDDEDDINDLRPSTPSNLLKDLSMFSMIGNSNWSMQSSNDPVNEGLNHDVMTLKRERSMIKAKTNPAHGLNLSGVINSTSNDRGCDGGQSDEDELTPASPGDLSKEFSGMSIESKQIE